MQISVIFASNFHPEIFIILSSMIKQDNTKKQGKIEFQKKNSCLFTKNMIFYSFLFLECLYLLYFDKLRNETNIA